MQILNLIDTINVSFYGPFGVRRSSHARIRIIRNQTKLNAPLLWVHWHECAYLRTVRMKGKDNKKTHRMYNSFVFLCQRKRNHWTPSLCGTFSSLLASLRFYLFQLRSCHRRAAAVLSVTKIYCYDWQLNIHGQWQIVNEYCFEVSAFVSYTLLQKKNIWKEFGKVCVWVPLVWR